MAAYTVTDVMVAPRSAGLPVVEVLDQSRVQRRDVDRGAVASERCRCGVPGGDSGACGDRGRERFATVADEADVLVDQQRVGAAGVVRAARDLDDLVGDLAVAGAATVPHLPPTA